MARREGPMAAATKWHNGLLWYREAMWRPEERAIPQTKNEERPDRARDAHGARLRRRRSGKAMRRGGIEVATWGYCRGRKRA